MKLNKPGTSNGASNNGAGGSGDGTTENGDASAPQTKVPEDIFDYYEKLDREDDDDAELKTVSFEINQDHLENLQKRYV